MGNPHKDLTGKRFGKLVVLEYSGKGEWLCKCDCGNTKDVPTYNLKNNTKSCGCLWRSVGDLTGQKIGALTVLEYAGDYKWLCICICGTKKPIHQGSLVSGETLSCGKKCHKRVDLTGQKYGLWTVIKYAGNSKWLCVCDCGTKRDVRSRYLLDGKSKSCGCLRRAKKRQTKKPKSRKSKPKTKKRGSIYLLRNDMMMYKIGFSTSVNNRIYRLIKELKDRSIEQVYKFSADDMPRAETKLHQQFANVRIGETEWFWLESEDINYIKSIARFENGRFELEGE